MAVTIDRGLVFRDSIDRKMDTNLTPEQHLLVRTGDIAYNMMRMWQGASGRAAHDGLISPAYIVCAPTNEIDSKFASYLFKFPPTVRKFQDHSHGITEDRLRLYYGDFASIRLPLPPLGEQRRIGEILGAWDDAIEKVNALIQAKQKLKRALMQQLLTPTRRFPQFGGAPSNGELADGWHRTALSKLGDTYPGLAGKSKDDFGSGKPYIPYLNVFSNSRVDPSNVGYVSIQPDERQHRVQCGDVLFTVSSETPEEVGMSSVLLDELGEAYLNSFCFGFRPSLDAPLLPEFAQFAFRSPVMRRRISQLAQGATRYNLSKNQVMRLQIDLPGMAEQKQIAELLQSSDAEVRLLVDVEG
ncbi:MAG: restriction endonuclease subunit S, partial [Planctomycetes bacterium]|nr:restriction endonuclease subunit S [Planctomycetota bacterium]